MNVHTPYRLRGRRGNRGQRGMAMILVMIVAGMALVLGLSFLSVQSTATGMAGNVERRAQARAVAESGLGMILAYLKHDPNWRVKHP